MGIIFQPKTDRNKLIYSLYKEKGYFSKEDREMIFKKYDIRKSRLYRIVERQKKLEEVR